jgi:hypothetical protein
MRTFGTGSTRDNIEGKLSFLRALSPAVLRRYVQYLAAHRKQADGDMRAFDNWKHGMPQEVYADSLLRHVWDLWSALNGEPTSEPTTPEELLCAIMFNAQGLLFERLVAKQEATREVINYDSPVAAAEPVTHTCGECARAPCVAAGFDPSVDAIEAECFVAKVPE